MSEDITEDLFERLTGAEDPADDLSKPAQDAEARNGLRHAVSLSMTKVADGLIDPKLVLSWLLNALGAPAYFVGLLVPIREAGALLPQIGLAAILQRMPMRKWMWAAGSLGQGIAAVLIVLAALTLTGWAAGAAICGALALLSVSRAAASVSFKDNLGKSVGKTRRGAITGTAGSLSSVGVLAFAGLMLSGAFRDQGLVIGAIALAAGLWVAAAALFSTLSEQPSQSDGQADNVSLSLLRDDPRLTHFILARGLLVSTALAPPYMVLLASEAGLAALDKLGALVLASAGASFLSSYVWGRLADRSSKTVLALSGVAAALAMLAAVGLAAAGLAQTIWAMPLTLFVLMVAYHGVRQGRSTYLVDMAPKAKRSAYAALSNTVIGMILLAAGAAGAPLRSSGPGRRSSCLPPSPWQAPSWPCG